jgi:8-oxo-dGTP pyrophosphatase MutT (NUDIX family)
VKTRTEISAGGVVFRNGDQGVELALAARRTRRGELAWGLPKGNVEEHETAEQTAEREVLEETGLVSEIRGSLGEISYWFVWGGERVHKTVVFFLMEAVGGDISEHDHEMEEIRWYPLDEAARLATYRGERDVIRRATRLLHAAS